MWVLLLNLDMYDLFILMCTTLTHKGTLWSLSQRNLNISVNCPCNSQLEWCTKFTLTSSVLSMTHTPCAETWQYDSVFRVFDKTLGDLFKLPEDRLRRNVHDKWLLTDIVSGWHQKSGAGKMQENKKRSIFLFLSFRRAYSWSKKKTKSFPRVHVSFLQLFTRMSDKVWEVEALIAMSTFKNNVKLKLIRISSII